jgi:Domain of unknown function (DUF5666)
MGQLGRSKTARTGVGIVAGVALLGGAFYGGRVYQNNVDQKLFGAYNPPQSNTGTRAGGIAFGSAGFGGGASQNAQINAALTVGNPPSSASSGSGAPSSASSISTSTSSTAGATSPGQGSAAAAGTSRALSGQVLSISGGTLTVQSFLGQESLSMTAQTHFYQVTTAAATALAVGQRAAIAPNRNDPSTATSVTIAPAGNVFVRVRSFSGGSGGFGSGGSGGGFGSGTGGGFGRGAGLAGTITALGHGTISVKTQQGGSQMVKLTALTAVYRVVAATREGLKAGSYVSVGSATINGRQVAADVVEATVPGTMPAIMPTT